jgi:methylenetetrahydrofolate--tRNA-(uracil-5-)-methyltransferase
MLTVIGGGLAGCEAAWQAAQTGVAVDLYEMRPHKRGPAHETGMLAELVCSNSMRGAALENAVGLLKEELARCDSLIITAARACAVPAGGALAVDRARFGALVEARLAAHPKVTIHREEVVTWPATGRVIVACGPLPSDGLAQAIDALVGSARLHYFDAAAPIVALDSLDTSVMYRKSRYDKGAGEDYLNIPLDAAAYRQFVADLRTLPKHDPKGFEIDAATGKIPFFEGCLPIEEMALRGEDALRFGPLKPVGLRDPRTGGTPYAVVQLRSENASGSALNLVGFQTRLTWPEQRRIFRGLPGMQNAEFLRLGQIHRNTFVNAPSALAPDLSLRALPNVFLAGQITGVEGYVESCACGSLVALALEARIKGLSFEPPPATTALGALYRHVTGEAHPEGYAYQPTNVTFGLFPPTEGRIPKQQRRQELVRRARSDFARWLGPGHPQKALDGVRSEVRAQT